jgi:hypothetical protein
MAWKCNGCNSTKKERTGAGTVPPGMTGSNTALQTGV